MPQARRPRHDDEEGEYDGVFAPEERQGADVDLMRQRAHGVGAARLFLETGEGQENHNQPEDAQAE